MIQATSSTRHLESLEWRGNLSKVAFANCKTTAEELFENYFFQKKPLCFVVVKMLSSWFVRKSRKILPSLDVMWGHPLGSPKNRSSQQEMPSDSSPKIGSCCFWQILCQKQKMASRNSWLTLSIGNLILILFSSAWMSYSKLENSTSFNPQNSNSAKLEVEKTWKTRITRAKTRNTWAKVELDTCLNSTVWNSMKLELHSKWAL